MKKVTIFVAALSVSAVFYGSLCFAESFTTTESVKVSRSEPVYKSVTTEKPVKECWEESAEVRDSGSGDIVGGIVGGAIGGALGSQVGKGSGKTAATIGGAIIGSMAGQKLSRGNSAPSHETVQKCKTRYESETKQVLSGYNNYATYKGKEIVKFSETPLTTITVYISVSY